MSGAEATGLVNLIDESIHTSEERIQAEVADYIEAHPEIIGEQIAERQFAEIPTFAGVYRLTEEQLLEIASQCPHLEIASTC
jgi:hypothetical protein